MMDTLKRKTVQQSTGVGLAVLLLVTVGTLQAHPVHTDDLQFSHRVNVPYFAGTVWYAESAVFWFGRVTPHENYADVRVGYNDTHLKFNVSVVDRRIWYDTSPSANELTDWDAVTLYLDLDGNVGAAPDANAYRFDMQFSWWEERDGFQTAYKGNGSSWEPAYVEFTTSSSYRGVGGPNQNADNRGWRLVCEVPFASLGLSGPPASETVWGLAATIHDRDDATGADPVIADKTWPQTMDPEQPVTWAQMRFGMPTYSPPQAVQTQVVTIRQGLNGAAVPDADVGGGSTCAEGIDFWTEWGNANYAGDGDLNIQNQHDIADWPCFSKYYVTFPLDQLPAGGEVISATLTLHKFGHAGDPGQARPSLIQVYTIDEAWTEETLTWNNAPLAVENVAATWVYADSFPGWPGTPYEWDVSGAVAEAHASEEPVRLALYEADWAYHSGKYFVSSDSYYEDGHPSLTVALGQRSAQVLKGVYPATPASGETVTYTVSTIASGRPLTLEDRLPAQVSAPTSIEVSGGVPASYESTTHRLTWSDTPDAGQPVTIVFPVTVLESGPLAISNTAVLTDGGQFTSSDTAVFIVDARSTCLPLVLREP